ncbi:MAG: hypothetical protein N2578_04765, partial [Bdellovibrionaceae bacterium]|nr:hypothetical protein [Pseudobdellovibrionaceae bacterium]
GEEWKLEPEDTTKKVDSSAVDQMLRNLRNAEAAFYVKAGEAKGLQSNSETLELMDGEGKLLFKLTWGGSFKRKSEGMEKSLFYARTNVSPEDIALEQSVIDRLELNNLTQPVPQEVKAEKAGP